MTSEVKIEEVNEEELNNKIGLICRQTNYDEKKAMNELNKNNLDPIRVIKEYMKKDVKEGEVKNESINKLIHTEIRNFFK